MGKKIKQFQSGDFIFAKVKGYPAWPARVQGVNGKKYFIYFYGTGEIANLPPTMIFDYAENKDKFLTKTVKRKDFNDGVQQIEYDFANNVPVEEVIGAAPQQDKTGPVLDYSTDANATADESAINETLDETAVDEANTTSQAETPKEDSDEGPPLVIDEKKKPTTRKSEVVKTPAKTVKELKTPRKKKEEEEDTKEKKDEEIVSRSGRKIRPKRYIDEQTDDNTPLPAPAPKKKRAATPEKTLPKPAEKPAAASAAQNKQYNAVSQSEIEDLEKPFGKEEGDKENLLIAYLPSGQYIGVKLFQNRPANFKSEAAQSAWHKQAVQNAIRLKLELERGQITPVSVTTQLETDLNLTDEEKSNFDKERAIEEKKSRVQFLKTEMKLIDLDAKIKTCLSLERADIDLCLTLLDELLALDLKPLMLLKHANCLETVKRMRFYVGNIVSWGLSEEETADFKQRTPLIRKRSDDAYNKFKDLFPTPQGVPFLEYFHERVQRFKKCTAKLTSDEYLEMVNEPLELSEPSSYTMTAAVESLNDSMKTDGDDAKKKNTPVKSKRNSKATPVKPTLKRQTSKNKEETTKKVDDSNDTAKEGSNTVEQTNDLDKAQVENVAESEASQSNDVTSTGEKSDKTPNSDEIVPANEEKDKVSEEPAKGDEKIVNENDSDKKEEKMEEDTKETAEDSSSTKAVDAAEVENNVDAESGAKESSKKPESRKRKDEVEEDKAKNEDSEEPKPKRGRESTRKVEPLPVKSPLKRKSRT